MFSSIACIFQSRKQKTRTPTLIHSWTHARRHTASLTVSHFIYLFIRLIQLVFRFCNRFHPFYLLTVSTDAQVSKANGILNTNILRTYIVYMCLCNFFVFFLFSSWKIQCHCTFFCTNLCYDFAVSFFLLNIKYIYACYLLVRVLTPALALSQFSRTFSFWEWLSRYLNLDSEQNEWEKNGFVSRKPLKKQHHTQSK